MSVIVATNKDKKKTSSPLFITPSSSSAHLALRLLAQIRFVIPHEIRILKYQIDILCQIPSLCLPTNTALPKADTPAPIPAHTVFITKSITTKPTNVLPLTSSQGLTCLG